MSVLQDYTLAGGGWSFASMAAAAEVFELAQEGYLTIRLPSEQAMMVRLSRTAKPAADLVPEQKELLAALFGSEDAPGQHVDLTRPHQFEIAQSLRSTSIAQLVQAGLVRMMSPLELHDKLKWTFLAVAIAACTVAVIFFHTVDGLLIIFVITATAWVLFGSYLAELRRKSLLYTRKGKARQKELFALRANCQSATPESKFNAEVTVRHLPYELLWGDRRNNLLSINQGLHDTAPDWCDGGWPPARHGLTTALQRTMRVMAVCLSYEGMLRRRYRTDDSEGGGLTDFDDAVWGLSYIASDFDGGGGGGGDGGDGGDGGGGDG